MKLVIVGDGPDREHLEAMNTQGDIIFTGGLSGTALAQAYASADVFAFISQVETFGNVVLQLWLVAYLSLLMTMLVHVYI